MRDLALLRVESPVRLTATQQLTYPSVAMLVCSAKRLVLALLVQGALIGHAVCVCSSLSSMQHDDSAGECPQHDGGSAGADQADSHHGDDPSCPHCRVQAALSVAKPDLTGTSPAFIVAALAQLRVSPAVASLESRRARGAEVPARLPPLAHTGVLQI